MPKGNLQLLFIGGQSNRPMIYEVMLRSEVHKYTNISKYFFILSKSFITNLEIVVELHTIFTKIAHLNVSFPQELTKLEFSYNPFESSFGNKFLECLERFLFLVN